MLPQPITKRPTVVINAPQCSLPPNFPPRYFNPGELDKLVALVNGVEPRAMIEFGCNEGHAAAALLLNVPTMRRYMGIDVLPGYITRRECQRNEIPAQPGKHVRDNPCFRLLLLKNGTFDLVAKDLPPCDVVFIDADHSRDGVLNDYALAKQVVQPGGLIIFHDDNGLSQVQVSETLDELVHEGAEIFHVADSWLAYEKIPC